MDEAEFWRSVDKSGDCWIWNRAKYGGGYGSLVFAGKCSREDLYHAARRVLESERK